MEKFDKFTHLILMLLGALSFNRTAELDDESTSGLAFVSTRPRRSLGWVLQWIYALLLLLSSLLDMAVHIVSYIFDKHATSIFGQMSAISNGFLCPLIIVAMIFPLYRREEAAKCMAEMNRITLRYHRKINRRCWVWLCLGSIGALGVLLRSSIAAIGMNTMNCWDYCGMVYHCSYANNKTHPEPWILKEFFLANDLFLSFQQLFMRILIYCITLPLAMSFRELSTRVRRLDFEQLPESTDVVTSKETLRMMQELGREHLALTNVAAKIDKVFREYLALIYFIDMTRVVILLGYCLELLDGWHQKYDFSEKQSKPIARNNYIILVGLLIGLLTRTIVIFQLDSFARRPYLALQEHAEVMLVDTDKPVAAVLLQRIFHRSAGLTCWGFCVISRKSLGSLFLTTIGYFIVAWELSRFNEPMDLCKQCLCKLGNKTFDVSSCSVPET